MKLGALPEPNQSNSANDEEEDDRSHDGEIHLGGALVNVHLGSSKFVIGRHG